MRPIRDRYKEASPSIPDTNNFSQKPSVPNEKNKEFPWRGTVFEEPPVYVSTPNPDGENEYSSNLGRETVLPPLDVEPTGFDGASEGKGKGLQIGTGAEPDCALKLEVTDKVASRQTVAVKGEGTWEDVDAIEYWSHGDKKITARPVGWRDSLGDILLFKGKYIQATYLDDNEYDDVESAIKAMWSNFLVESAKQYESFKKNFPFNLAQKKDKQGKDGKVAEPGDSKKK